MLTAIRHSDKKKVIGESIHKNTSETYECEYCNKNVIHHKSGTKIKIGHFKHQSGHSFCPNKTNEGVWHYSSKLDIFNYIKSKWVKNLKSIDLEVWLAKKTIRADIYLETLKGNKIAIEVQASVLDVNEIIKRTEKYKIEGIYVMWIIPYEYLRFNELYKKYGWNEQKWEVIEEQWDYKESIKLKEFEIFLYWAYFKKIFAWDLTHEHSNQFISIELKEYTSQPTSFFKDGEEMQFNGKKTKTKKELIRIHSEISFDKLTIRNEKSFKLKDRNYIIPERKILIMNN